MLANIQSNKTKNFLNNSRKIVVIKSTEIQKLSPEWLKFFNLKFFNFEFSFNGYKIRLQVFCIFYLISQ